MEFIFIGLIVILDQVTKYLAKTRLINVVNIDLVEGYFSLTYVENRGAAFGIFRDKRFVLVGITALAIGFMIYYLVKSRKKNKWIRISLTLIIAGAVGNLIDRIFLGYVVDFFHFYIYDVFDYPVFNVADISVVSGTILLAINLLFSKELQE